MTLILGLTVGEVPVLMGDTLLSSPGEAQDKLVHTPAVENVNVVLGKEIAAHVVELRQKVNVLGDNVIIGWSGSYIQAYSLFKDVTKEIVNNPNPRCIADILRSVPADDKNELSVIGFVRGPQNTTFFWDGVCWHFDSKVFSKLVGAGSGAQDMASIIHRFEKSWEPDDATEDYGKAIFYAMALGSQVVGLEHLTLENLWMLWGGGIEIGIFSNGKARKVSDVLYAFWDCAKQDDGTWRLTHVPTFVKLEYQGDLMVTRTVSELTIDRFSVIPPLLSRHKAGEQVEVRPPSLSYDWLCSCIVAREGNRPVDVFSHVQGKGWGRPVRFRERQSIFPKYEHSLTATVDRQYHRAMAELASYRLVPGQRTEVILASDG